MATSLKPPCDEGLIRGTVADEPRPPGAGNWILAATILGSSLAFIDGTVVNVALPAIQADLQATVAELQWIIESYALFLAALVLVGGAAGDRWGRRRVFSIGVAIFALSSAWCGLSPTVGQIIVARAVQGVGAALLVPASLAIISAFFADEERGKAIGTWSAFTSITAAIGPVLGGWLIDNSSWRAAFLINIPLAAIVLGISLWRVPESRSAQQHQGLDLWGALLATLGLGSIVYGLLEYPNLGPSHPTFLGTLALGVLAIVGFLVVEARGPAPMMPLDVFRSSTFTGANLLTLLLYAALGANFFFVPFLLIQVQGYSATAAGSAYLPFILAVFLLSRWAGGLVTRYGPRLPLVVGPIVAAAGFALFALPGIGGSYWTTYLPAMLVLGLGMAVTVAPLTTTVMDSVEPDRAGLASGINNAVARVASLLAVAVLGIIVLLTFSSSLDSRLDSLPLAPGVRDAIRGQENRLAGTEIPAVAQGESRQQIQQAIGESFLASFRLTMLIAVALAVGSALCAALLIEGKHPVATAKRETDREVRGRWPSPRLPDRGNPANVERERRRRS